MGRETNRQRRERQASSTREKAAAARAQQARADQRRRAVTILSSVAAIAVVGVVIVIIALHSTGKSSPSDRALAPASVVNQVTGVSDATLTTIGKGNVATTPAPVTGETPLTAGGKPELLYIGAEFCPYCAVERWSLVEALSRFGTFKSLGTTRSGSDDGNYASLDFYKSSYTSKYLTFTSVENEDRNRATLEKVTSAQNTLWNKLDNNSPGFPFLDFGNLLALTTHPPLDPTVLGTANQAAIAAQLDTATSKIAQTIGGGANDDIAAICKMTNNAPASVCSSSTITALQGSFTS